MYVPKQLTNLAKTATVLGGLALAACGSDETSVNKVDVMPDVRSVPVLEYTVQRGDSLIGLVNSEINRSSHPFRNRDRGNSIAMAGIAHRENYYFGTTYVFEALNPQFPRTTESIPQYAQQFNASYELQIGEKLLFPDLNGDGKIRGQNGKKVGALLFSAYRSSDGPGENRLTYLPNERLL